MKNFLALIEGNSLVYQVDNINKTCCVNPTSIIIQAYSIEQAETELYKLLKGRYSLNKVYSESEALSNIQELINTKSENYIIKGLIEIS